MKLSIILFAVVCISAIFASGVSADPEPEAWVKSGRKPRVGSEVAGVGKEILVDTVSDVASTQINKVLGGDQVTTAEE